MVRRYFTLSNIKFPYPGSYSYSLPRGKMSQQMIEPPINNLNLSVLLIKHFALYSGSFVVYKIANTKPARNDKMAGIPGYM
jgi:hypothetical protein